MANTTTYTLILDQEKAREFIMPAGYWPDVEIHCWGAGGGGGWGGGTGGGGGYSSVLVDMDPGDRVRLQIGQPGRNAANTDIGGGGGSDGTDSRFNGGRGGRRIANTETRVVNYVIDEPLARLGLTNNNVTSIVVPAADGPYPSGGGGGASWVSINDSIVCVAAGGGGGGGYGKNGIKYNGNPGGIYPTQASSVYAVSYFKWSSFLNTYGVWGGGEDYTTLVNFPVTGTYTFILSTDNFGSIFVDNTLILSYGEYRNATSTTASFTAGDHIVRVTGGNYGGPAGVGALITAPGGAPIWNTRELLVTSGLTINSQGGDAVYGGGGGGGYYGGKSGFGTGGAVTGGNGGQNYGDTTAPGSGVFPGGRSGYYPGNKVGEADYPGYIAIVMRKKLNAFIKNPDSSGDWVRLESSYVKIPTESVNVLQEVPTVTLTYNSVGTNSWTVPAGVSLVNLTVIGGGGGGGGSDSSAGAVGHAGARVSGSLAVTPGQVLTAIVGSGGGAGSGESGGAPGGRGGTNSLGYNGGSGSNSGSSGLSGAGGGGGAASAVIVNNSPVIVAAGGGGGGGGGNGIAGRGISPGGFTGSPAGGAGTRKSGDGGGAGGGGGGYPLGGNGGAVGGGDSGGYSGNSGQSLVPSGFTLGVGGVGGSNASRGARGASPGGGGSITLSYTPTPIIVTTVTGGWKQIQQAFTKVDGEWKPILTDTEITLYTY